MALALTACSSTNKPLDTPIKVVEKPVMPMVPSALLVAPLRPEAPRNGTTQTILEHAVDFGAYVSELESQNTAWRKWSQGGVP